MIKFVNFKLLAQLNGLMGQAGLDWRMERIQRGKCLWTHVLIKNMTGDENNARVYVYVNTDENIMYPVIWVNGADKYEYLRNKVIDQEGITELSDSEYEEIGEKNHDHARLYKLDGVAKIANCGPSYDWIEGVIEQTKKLTKVMSNVLY